MIELVKGLNVSESELERFSQLLDKYIGIGKELYTAIIE